MITKERMDEALKLLKNDPKYYVTAKTTDELFEHWKELYSEIENLDECVSALKSFAKVIEDKVRLKAFENINQKQNEHK